MQPNPNPVLVAVSRGELVESTHRGAVSVVRDGKEALALGDTSAPVYLRSAMKPIQALPLVLTGAADACGLSDEEVAVACGSHNGEEVHVRAVRSILTKAKLPENLLECGAIDPLDAEVRRALDRSGEYSPVRNNCSGKHAGFLLVAKHLGADLEGYTDPQHPVQQLVRETFAELAEEDAHAMPRASDGCTAPSYAIPLKRIALVFGKLANPQSIERHELSAAAARIRAAVLRCPYMIAGRNRICTDIMEAAEGRVLAKSGAEGVYAGGLVDRSIGFAVKIDDGASRGYTPVVMQFLIDAGVFTAADAVTLLDRYTCPLVLNQKSEVVGAADVAQGVSFASLFAG
ncbi:MAG: hypothetical protein AUJ92_13870 [Armatimonadetes bacterium CG2_30_59_28]|nr:asparaginase [Armatimonadota bacterium]OIO92575.1 MAG: hypothetical protein AUJ92_13870 [Armatimonadetes bacterium CG2_30_59_28]